MKINIYNLQRQLTVSKTSVNKQVKAILDHENIVCDELSICFVDEKTIKRMHKKFFNDPSTTDCISFPIDGPKKAKNYCFLGEVFICTTTAVKYGKENNVDAYDETTLYMIHSILHLIGYDDISEKDKTNMRKKEKSCMNLIRAQKLGLCSKHTKYLIGQK